MNGLCNTLTPYGIVTSLLAHGEELLPFFLRFGIPQAVEVGARHGVYHLSPKLDADFAILVQDVLAELVIVDAG
jgi:hypothetical protein